MTDIQHQTNAAPTSVVINTPALATGYRLAVSALIKTATTLTFKLAVTYTGADGSSHTDLLPFIREGSTASGTSLTVADRYSCTYSFIIDNSATAITVADSSGTYTTCEYWLKVDLVPLAP